MLSYNLFKTKIDHQIETEQSQNLMILLFGKNRRNLTALVTKLRLSIELLMKKKKSKKRQKKKTSLSKWKVTKSRGTKIQNRDSIREIKDQTFKFRNSKQNKNYSSILTLKQRNIDRMEKSCLSKDHQLLTKNNFVQFK